MNLPFRKRSGVQTNPIIPEMNGPVQPSSGRQINWLRVVVAAVVGLVILGALVWGGVWLSNRNSNPPKTVSTSSGSARPNSSKQSPNSSKSNSSSQQSTPSSNSGSSTGSSSAAPQTAGGQQQTQAQSQTANGNLANSGPGDTLAIFAGAVVAGTALYQIILRRQSSKN